MVQRFPARRPVDMVNIPFLTTGPLRRSPQPGLSPSVVTRAVQNPLRSPGWAPPTRMTQSGGLRHGLPCTYPAKAWQPQSQPRFSPVPSTFEGDVWSCHGAAQLDLSFRRLNSLIFRAPCLSVRWPPLVNATIENSGGARRQRPWSFRASFLEFGIFSNAFGIFFPSFVGTLR